MTDVEDIAEAFVTQRKACVGRWTNRDGDYVAISYWHGPKMRGRVHVVARNLVEAVEMAAAAERLQAAQGLC